MEKNENGSQVEEHFASEINNCTLSNKQNNLDCSNASKLEANEDEVLNEDKSDKTTQISNIVAQHYNSLQNVNVEERKTSRIYYLRNLNNWIKSLLIQECVSKLPSQRNLKILDMCCGKGGDLKKWMRTDLKYLICADFAETSLEQCKERHKEKQWSKTFECKFIHADCTRVRLREKYDDPSIELDVVSCQFSFHYCFESLPQAECMLRNASECLKSGGLFIGTIPNANEIVKRIKQSKNNVLENDVFSIEMFCTEPYPLFGAKYNFYLEGSVNCPEFLVHFPTLEKLAQKFGLRLIYRKQFTEIFNDKKEKFKSLLQTMSALETYPPEKGEKLIGEKKDYAHIESYEICDNRRMGTISKSEWEVFSLYQTFIFEKVPSTWDSKGHQQYQF